MNNLAIIPARSSSKGLKNKNIKELNGKPLMAYTIESALLCKQFNTVMVSTDSEQYKTIAQKYGAEVPFLRSKDASSDMASSWTAVLEVLNSYWELGRVYDTVCLLQPTSPLRRPDDITNAYKIFEEKKADAVTSVCEVDHSPLWNMKLSEDLSMLNFRKMNQHDLRRQQLDKYYRLNGAIYIRAISYKNNVIELLDSKEYAYIMSRKNSIDIDSIDDFEYAEYRIKNVNIEDV
ncbi:MAG: acylneuraminate cytidylyltransferase family protein [Lachnospiraceae bacterium]|nr:acylneuraminate cytidylyltransferase family protein [Lachnospiraceae bacterium]